MLTATSSSVTDDPYTGLYYVHGSKIMTFYTCPFIETCTPDDGLFIDTTRIASVVAVKWMEEKTDTLHFFGLPGADEGERKVYFGDSELVDFVFSLGRYDDFDHSRVFGSLSDNKFEINHNHTSNRYIGIGTISNRKIEINAQQIFRTITVEYDLTGEKITLNR
jgi:hypothetical protein